jgi:hypothetical protein
MPRTKKKASSIDEAINALRNYVDESKKLRENSTKLAFQYLKEIQS